jgi:penicillin-binding protein 2
MPIDPANDRRPPITPQLAIRVAGVGVVAFVLFGIVFFRLWYLQVLDGDKYLAQARDNRVRTERIAAPRGNIVDAGNLPLVTNRKATVVSLDPASIPASMVSAINAYGQQAGLREARPKGHKGAPVPLPMATGSLLTRYERLGHVLVLTPKTINERVVNSIVQVPYANIRIKTGVPAAQRDYIEERHEAFPGVTVEQQSVRSYPNNTMAAQLLGTVGQITQKELADKKDYKGIPGGTDIGQTGLESEYDKFLRGTDGRYNIEVNAAGERRQATTAVQPKSGQELKLTLHQDLQQTGEAAIKTLGGGLPGAFVAMNPTNGAIYAMGSNPSYDPRDAAPGRYSTNAAYASKFLKANTGHPLIDRADESAYPTGSIFKPVTALAALSTGVTTTTQTFDDTGCFQTGARKDIDVSCNTDKEPNGIIDMADALRVSSDTFFYHLGKELYGTLPSLPLQSWAHKLGVARKTGIDLPGEATGSVPSPAATQAINKAELACRKRKHVASCGIGSTGHEQWNPGDMTNFAVGQGGLQATPLQMAVAYSTIINSGRVPTPHLGLEVSDSRGIVQPLDFPSRRKVDIKPEWRATILNGLSQAANADGGTSKQVWDNGWPRDRYPIFGKTGTAERPPHPDQSWYVAYSYDKQNPDAKPIVVVCTIEGGGFGADSAAPAARLIMSQWFGVQKKIVHGDSNDT